MIRRRQLIPWFSYTYCRKFHGPRRNLTTNEFNILSPENTYERKTPIEHVLLRPGMYIGEVESKESETWLYDSTKNVMSKELVSYSPALLKVCSIDCFDFEIETMSNQC